MNNRFESRINNTDIQHNYYKKEEKLKNLKIKNQIEKYFCVEFEILVKNISSWGKNEVYFTYDIIYGEEWILSKGLNTNKSHIASSNQFNKSDNITFNYSIDLTFKSSNIQGWPSIVLKINNKSFWGKPKLLGYGCIKMPFHNGLHKRTIKLFQPKPFSYYDYIVGYYEENKPVTFKKPRKTLANNNEGREFTRNDSLGDLNIEFNVRNKNLKEYGFQI